MNGRRAREVMPAAMRALEREPVAVNTEDMAPTVHASLPRCNDYF